MVEESEEKVKRITWPQWIAGCGAFLLVVQMGAMSAWSSPYIGQLTSPESPFPVTTSQISWIVSLINVGRPIGAIGGAISVHCLGSKSTNLAASIPGALYWLCVLLSNSVEWLYVARLFGGVSMGMTFASYSLFLGEIADAKIRGALVSLGTSGLPVGNFLMSAMGAYFSIRVSAAISLAACVGLIILFFWLPESPHHLIRKNMHEKAKSSIRWYHRDSDVELEFITLRKFTENLSKQSLSDTLQELRRAHVRKYLLLIMILIMYTQISGVNSILFYMEPILTAAKISAIPPAKVVIIVMAFGIVGSVLSIFLMDKCGRKILMITSCIGVTIFLLLLTTAFHLLGFGFDPILVETLSIVSMCGSYLTVFAGVFPVPPAMLAELFPPHLKCIAACLVSATAGIIAFISAATYAPLLEILSERYLFLFYGLLTATAAPFTIFCVPETKGMSLEDIQNQLKQGNGIRGTVSACTDQEQRCREENLGPFVIS